MRSLFHNVAEWGKFSVPLRVGVHFTIDTENQPALFRSVWCTPRVGHGAFDDEMVLRRDVRDIV